MTAATRLVQVRAALKSAKLDAAIFFDEHSVVFFTGFASSNALYVVSQSHEYFFTDGRYLAAAKKHFQDTNIDVQDISTTKWKPFFQRQKIASLGVSFERIFADRLEKWRTDFGVTISDFSLAENKLRAAKSTLELERLSAVATLADKALSQVLPQLQVGITEKAFAWELEKAGRELGAEAVSFPSIVAFGEHSALPHHHPTDRKLAAREPILIDWGFQKDGFCSDCTRCFFFGQPTAAWLQAYERVLQAQAAGIAKIQGANLCSAPHEAAVASLGEAMIHSFGHGVGLEVHEYPAVSIKSKDKFIPNMVVTAEPGLYFPQKFGIRIEDTLVVMAKGNYSLTALPKAIKSSILKI